MIKYITQSFSILVWMNGGVTLEKIRIGIVGYGNLGKGAELE